MSNRKKIPKITETRVLVSSRRRCAICFGLDTNTEEKKGQIAHLDRDNSNNNVDNLAYLCLEHHDQYDSRTSQSKGLTIEEVKEFRGQLYHYVATNFPGPTVSKAEVVEIEIQDDGSRSVITQENHQNLESSLTILAKEFGISENQLAEDFKSISILMEEVEEAGLSGTQMHIFALIVENANNSEVPYRVIESSAGYDFRSTEFFEEMRVIEYRELAFVDEDDGKIYLSVGDWDVWQLLNYLLELRRIEIYKFLKNPRIELLLNDEE